MRPLQQTRGIDAAVGKLAGRQHGVVGKAQVETLGLSADAIKRRLRSGRLHPLDRGVYAVGHIALTQHSRWMAAVLACGPGAVLSHWSAAELWRLRERSGGAIHVTSPSKTRSRGAIRRHCAHLPADEVTIHEGIPVTTVPRTILDLATVVKPPVVESALRQSEYLRRYDSLSLWDLLERYPGHRGNRAIRWALGRLEESSGHTQGRFEDRFLAFLARHSLPRPHFNVWLTVGTHRYRADCLWPRQRQIVELDSWQAHGTRSAFRNDKARDRRLAVAGYRTTRIAWSQLDDEPEEIAADLRTLLAA